MKGRKEGRLLSIQPPTSEIGLCVWAGIWLGTVSYRFCYRFVGAGAFTCATLSVIHATRTMDPFWAVCMTFLTPFRLNRFYIITSIHWYKPPLHHYATIVLPHSLFVFGICLCFRCCCLFELLVPRRSVRGTRKPKYYCPMKKVCGDKNSHFAPSPSGHRGRNCRQEQTFISHFLLSAIHFVGLVLCRYRFCVQSSVSPENDKKWQRAGEQVKAKWEEVKE